MLYIRPWPAKKETIVSKTTHVIDKGGFLNVHVTNVT